MMVLTSVDGKLALTHVIKNVFELPTDHLLASVLTQAGIIDIGDVLSMPYDNIHNLTYTDDQGNDIPVGKASKW